MIETKIINGKEISKGIRERLQSEIAELLTQGIVPGLTVVLVGDDPASHSYVKSKERAAKKLGINSQTIRQPADITQSELLNIIRTLNREPSCHGILVQLPLPSQIDENIVINSITPEKDVDGFHPINLGRMLLQQAGFLPCTPAGVMELLAASSIELSGKNVVILGRSNIVGKPLAMMMMPKSASANATVTVCHSRTQNLQAHTKQADIIVAAIGQPGFLKPQMVKSGVVIIDVGTNSVERDGKNAIVGDVDFEGMQGIASAITPVPKGVGPMTITMLMQNTVTAAKNQLGN